MNDVPARLVARLVAVQLIVHVIAFALTAAFAPRVLLLEDAAASAAVAVVAVLGVFAAAFSTAATLVATRALGQALRSLSLGSSAVDPEPVLWLYALPARLAIGGVAFVMGASIVTVVPGVRPQSFDATAGITLVLLLFTLVSTAALPSYVLMRAAVARVLELAPPGVTQRALRLLGMGLFKLVRKRLVLAVAAPVAFVALGASLLVDAHARARDREARVEDARDMARAVFEPLASDAAGADAKGRAAAIEAAAALGYRVRIEPDYKGDFALRRGDDGETQIAVALDRGAVLVRFGTTRVSPVTVVYVLLALVAVALAAILGTRIAGAFEKDVALATREIRHAGVADVMRGTIIMHDARFAMVGELLQTIDSLGGVFREFASAQQRAIEAREATERMRGLLLASMSHDLKAPLNAVLGFAELVGRSELTEAQYESLAIIEQRGRELLVLIDTILDSARAEAGELEVSPEPTHVGDVVMSAVLEARELSVGSDVQIGGEIQPGMPRLFVDGTRVAQALTAVVMTAARFSHKGIVPVRATLPGEGERLCIEVETSGEGLPLAEREKVFDAFKSAESARRQGGLGLGLQLARSIVAIHGGSIEVEATPGGGIVFRMWLPVAEDRASIRARASRPRWHDD